jgi:hypothetical protein
VVVAVELETHETVYQAVQVVVELADFQLQAVQALAVKAMLAVAHLVADQITTVAAVVEHQLLVLLVQTAQALAVMEQHLLYQVHQ